MRQLKIYTVTQVHHVGHDRDVTAWDRAFASKEEAEAMVRECAMDEWSEGLDEGRDAVLFPGIKFEDGAWWLEVLPEDTYVQWYVTEADLDLP